MKITTPPFRLIFTTHLHPHIHTFKHAQRKSTLTTLLFVIFYLYSYTLCSFVYYYTFIYIYMLRTKHLFAERYYFRQILCSIHFYNLPGESGWYNIKYMHHIYAQCKCYTSLCALPSLMRTEHADSQE